MKLTLLLIALPFLASAALAADEAMPPLTPKPYTVGIAPSHITIPTDPLFAPGAPWTETQKVIDFYKYYALQTQPPDWCTAIPVKAFVDFMKSHNIAIHSEFGSFGGNNGVDEGMAAVRRALAEHQPIWDAGGRLAVMHLDGPIWRLLKKKNPAPGLLKKNPSTGLPLDQAAEQIAIFFQEFHKVHPEVEIGLITNFPNWDYTDQQYGVLGGFTNKTGVTYDQAVTAVYEAVKKRNEKIAFIEVDCPYNYYRATRAIRRDLPVDNPKMFRDLHAWCQARGIRFQLVVNFETNAKRDQGNIEAFHDGTLDYIRALRRDGIFPDAFTIQSWYKEPRENLPEDKAGTFMNAARDAVRLIRELYPAK
ncbi:MAG: hypothetical protein M1457_00440 [bacterium]|nr:hypothetical protein [bacterium]